MNTTKLGDLPQGKTYNKGRKIHTNNRSFRKAKAILVFGAILLSLVPTLRAWSETVAEAERITSDTSFAFKHEVKEKELSMQEYVLNEVEKAGLNKYEAYIIINCESRWDSNRFNVNSNKTIDLGLWQINTIHKNISNIDKMDYKKATAWSIEKRIKDGNWKAWVCSKQL